jgi:hypothetical protein
LYSTFILIKDCMDISKKVQDVMHDQRSLDAYVYTPWREAFVEIERRRTDARLQAYIETILKHGIPESMVGKKSIVLFRHIATPNYEVNRFIACADTFTDFEPQILEYTEDLFNDRNQWKYFLGKLRFQRGMGKNGERIFENVNIINFNESNNKKISSVVTHWGQSLVDFHHEMFKARFKDFTHVPSDISHWLHKYGMSSREYYKPFLTMFLRDGILFDNIRLDVKERKFTETIILPLMCEIEEESGYKPLIVTLAPTKLEADDFILSHPYSSKSILNGKIGDKK